MRRAVLFFVLILALTGANRRPAGQAGRQYLPLTVDHYERGMIVQPVWYVQALAGDLAITGSLPVECSELRWEVVPDTSATAVVLWSVRPDRPCFDTLKPFVFRPGLTCTAVAVRGQTVKCAHEPYP